jgi:hypothetical protein
VQDERFTYDRYLVDQLVRPVINLYRVTPLAAGESLVIDGRVIGDMNRRFQLRDRYVLDLSAEHERTVDRRLGIALAIGLDTLQNR